MFSFKKKTPVILLHSAVPNVNEIMKSHLLYIHCEFSRCKSIGGNI